MRTLHTLAISALLALTVGPVGAQDSRAPGHTFPAAVPTDDHSDISRQAMTATPYEWNASHAEHRALTEFTEAPMTLRSILTLSIALLFMLSATIFTLVFAYRSMRAQMRQERIHYQPRGPAGHAASP